jgi:hypothetical protein
MWLNRLKTAQSYEKASKMQRKNTFFLHFQAKVTSARAKVTKLVRENERKWQLLFKIVLN